MNIDSAMLLSAKGFLPVLWEAVFLAFKTGILLVMAMGIIAAMSRRGALARYVFLRMTVAATIALPLVDILVLFWNRAVPDRVVSFVPINAAISKIGVLSEFSPVSESNFLTYFVGVLFLVWVGGLVWLMFRMAVGIYFTSRTIRNARDFERVTLRTGISERVKVLVSARLTIPFAWGFRRPIIVLPEKARAWSDEKLRLVLSHEYTHIIRHDQLWIVLSGIVCALYWFNPLAWIIRNKMIIEAEKACDDAVIANGANPENYSGYLIEIIKDIGRPGIAAPVAVQMAKYNQMEGRIMSILNGKVRKTIISRKTLFGLTVLMAVIVIGLATCSDTGRITGSSYPDNTTEMSESLKGMATDAIPSPEEFVPVDTMPVMLSIEDPVYPPEAKNKNIEGVVYIREFVDKNGNVKKVQIAKSSGYDILDRAALEAGWTAIFAPAIKNGEPVGIWITYSVQFSMKEKMHP